jgi:hypothetical protein
MNPRYLSQHYLQLPPIIGKTHLLYTVLPQPNVIDKWILNNQGDAWTNNLLHGYLFLSDTPNDQVLCTLQLSVMLVRLHFSSNVHNCNIFIL